MITKNHDGSVQINNTDLQLFIQDILDVAKTGIFSTCETNTNYAKRDVYGWYSVTIVPVVEKPAVKPHHFSKEAKAAKEAKAKAEENVKE